MQRPVCPSVRPHVLSDTAKQILITCGIGINTKTWRKNLVLVRKLSFSYKTHFIWNPNVTSSNLSVTQVHSLVETWNLFLIKINKSKSVRNIFIFSEGLDKLKWQ
jgi:hypothetical protein